MGTVRRANGTANGITDGDRQRSILLAKVGPSTHALISSLVSPAKPCDKSFKDLVTLLKKHYNPEPSEIVQRFKFHTRVRQTSETVSQFIAELRSIPRYCNFKETLNDALRDRIVCGCMYLSFQIKIFTIVKFSLKLIFCVLNFHHSPER